MTYWLKPVITRFFSYIRRNLSGDTVSFERLIMIAIPILLDSFIGTAVGVVNNSLISSSGAQSVAAVSMIGDLDILLEQCFVALATAGIVIIAQYVGKGDRDKARKASGQVIFSAVSFAVLLGILVLVFMKPLLTALFGNAEEEVFNGAVLYLTGLCISFPFYAAFQASLSPFYGSGNTKTAMALDIIISVIYMLLTVLFVGILRRGIWGLTSSLLLTRVFGCAIAFILLFRSREGKYLKAGDILRPNIGFIKSILMIGIPIALEQVFFNGGKVLIQTFIVMLGTVSLAANAIAGAVSGLFYIPANVLAVVAMTVTGQCIGAERVGEAKRLLRNITVASAVVSAAAVAVMLPLSPLLLKLYHISTDVASLALLQIIITSVGLPLFWSQGFMMPSGLRAAGDVKFTTLTAMSSMWFFRVVFSYVFAIRLHFGLSGIYLAMILEWAVRGFVFMLRIRGVKWYRHKVIQ